MEMPGRKWTYQDYRFGMGGKEDLDEWQGDGNMYDYVARLNDPRIARWLSLDPWAKKYPWQSPYVSMDNKPVAKIDPSGKGTESVHVDENGKVLRNYNDGDNTVYMHKIGTTGNDIDKKYVSMEGHSAGGKKIGELGGTIDIHLIFTNVLNNSRAEAKETNALEWVNKVRLNGKWDLKNNKETIFGVAWEYDIKRDAADTKNEHTEFLYNDCDKYLFDAAAVGNYHAGFTGSVIGISTRLQKMGAGFVEQTKGDVSKNLKQYVKWVKFMSRPYGDAKHDFYWNERGMRRGCAAEARNFEGEDDSDE
jgi:RHS repeat-associated protein